MDGQILKGEPKERVKNPNYIYTGVPYVAKPKRILSERRRKPKMKGAREERKVIREKIKVSSPTLTKEALKEEVERVDQMPAHPELKRRKKIESI